VIFLYLLPKEREMAEDMKQIILKIVTGFRKMAIKNIFIYETQE
jgi:hypothetical protein